MESLGRESEMGGNEGRRVVRSVSRWGTYISIPDCMPLRVQTGKCVVYTLAPNDPDLRQNLLNFIGHGRYAFWNLERVVTYRLYLIWAPQVARMWISIFIATALHFKIFQFQEWYIKLVRRRRHKPLKCRKVVGTTHVWWYWNLSPAACQLSPVTLYNDPS